MSVILFSYKEAEMSSVYFQTYQRFCAVYGIDHIITLLDAATVAEQVVKVMWHEAASQRRTDHSIVFAKRCQCASLSNTWFLGSTRVCPQQHLNRFGRFCGAHWCSTQTTECVTCVAMNRICKTCDAAATEEHWAATHNSTVGITQRANSSKHKGLFTAHELKGTKLNSSSRTPV